MKVVGKIRQKGARLAALLPTVLSRSHSLYIAPLLVGLTLVGFQLLPRYFSSNPIVLTSEWGWNPPIDWGVDFLSGNPRLISLQNYTLQNTSERPVQLRIDSLICPGPDYSYEGSYTSLEYWSVHKELFDSDYEKEPDEVFGNLDAIGSIDEGTPLILLEPSTLRRHIRIPWELNVLDKHGNDVDLFGLLKLLKTEDTRRQLVMRVAPPHPNMKCELNTLVNGKRQIIEYQTFQTYVGGRYWMPVVPENDEDYQRMLEEMKRRADPFSE